MDSAPVDPLAPWLRDQLGVEPLDRTPVGGGCIHHAWCLRTAGGGRLFAKTTAADRLPLLEAEAEGLEALGQVAPPGLVVPQPLALGQAGPEAVLVLPWLDLARGEGRPGSWGECGANLARLHRRGLPPGREGARPQGFGWPRDNFIGASPQQNGWRQDWAVFFITCRLRPQLTWLEKGGRPLAGGTSLLERLLKRLAPHKPDPCLVHGDLWSGNAALLADGRGSLFDPAVHRGDREVDLAMARLFGGVPEAFFQGYQEEWPLPEGWRERQAIYNLYHLLNHANLFGGTYKKQAQSVINDLLDQ
ncbi:MAG: fructosamine kinase family protein [Cyanobacteriota bacterium]|nr:fructosamine kinase family protein [Cyanobacteriota bacterium]